MPCFLQNITITQIIFETANATYTIDGTLTNPKLVPAGYILARGENVTIVCPWNWKTYISQSITITVQTTEGFKASKTLQVE